MIFLSLIFGVGCANKNNITLTQEDQEIMQLIRDGKYDDAIRKTKEFYSGEDLETKLKAVSVIIDSEKKLNEGRQEIKDKQASPVEKLVILSDWKYTIDGDYNYITGRVKNTSNKNIKYFKLVAEYMNEDGVVLDSKYTNSINTIRPGNMEEFKITKEHKNEYKQVRMFVEEVRTE